MKAAAPQHRSFLYLGSLFLFSSITAILLEEVWPLLFPFLLLLLRSGWAFPFLPWALLLISIPFSIEYAFDSGLGTDLPDEPLMLLTAFIGLATALYAANTNWKLRPQLILSVLGILLLWTLLTVYFSTNQLISFKYLLAKGWYLGAFVLAPVVVLSNPRLIRISALLLGGSMFCVTLLILFRQAGQGFLFAAVNEAVSPFFRNHVNYSALLVCMIPVWAASYFLSGSLILKRLVLLILLISLTALFFSYARGAWLALLTGGISYWLIRRKILVYVYLFVLAAALGTFTWLASEDRYLQWAPDYQRTVFHTDFNEHLTATYALRDMSAAERFHRWIAGIRMIQDRPLTGYGPGTFYEQYKPYTVPAFRTWVSDNPERSTIHNYYLLTLTEQGIPGLFFWILLTSLLLLTAQRIWHQSADRFTRIAAMTTGVILVMLLTLNSLSDLVETDKAGSLFFICLAVLVVLDRKQPVVR